MLAPSAPNIKTILGQADRSDSLSFRIGRSKLLEIDPNRHKMFHKT